MTETQKRINAYKEALPGLKERVIAAVMLLILSTTMMASATFAWLTASEKPEVAGTMTQVSANGNLEIALVKPVATDEEGDPIYPDPSKVGDSSAAEGQTVYNSNLTWGNLLNLSDSSYGLHQIVLRPARLRMSSLGTKPFESVLYGADGRVTVDSNSEFSYFTWVTDSASGVPQFEDTGHYGVRAIASGTSKYQGDISDGELAIVTEYNERLKQAEDANKRVNDIYQNDILKSAHMDSLFVLMGHYMTNNMNSGQNCAEDTKDPVCNEQMEPLAALFDLFYSAMEAEIDAIVAQVNVQQFVRVKGTDYTPYTATMFKDLDASGMANLEKKLKSDGCQVTGLTEFLKDMATAKEKKAALDEMIYNAQTGTVYRVSALKTIIDALVEVKTSIVYFENGKTYTISQIGATVALGMNVNDEYNVEIQNGILARFERRVGTYAFLEGRSVTATGYRYGMTQSRTLKDVNIYTKYKNTQESRFADDNAYTQERFAASGMDKGELVWTVGDTYGLAVDMWVRTNAIGDENGKTYLMLEGQLQYDQSPGLDANGNEVGLLYYYETDNAQTGTKDKNYVYQTTDGKWYAQGTSDEVSVDGKLLKEAYSDAPTGYEGNNRVWQVDQQGTLQPALSEYATTQGNGSSFTFYADTPAQQQAILNLLKHMHVVFTDGGDGYYSVAGFNTDENAYYAQGGKITVPLVIQNSQYSFVEKSEVESMEDGAESEDGTEGEEDDEGTVVRYAVTELTRNEPTRVTAILYLDGTQLTNKEALTAEDLSGTLNLQFGSSENLVSQTDRELQVQERFVSAKLNSAAELDFFRDSGNLGASVEVTVTGDKPGNVTGFFQREINSYQGSRGETVTFTQNGEVWDADFTFTAPGNYIMRYIILDGVEYELTEPIRVTITGFSITNLDIKYDGQYLGSATEQQIVTVENSVTLETTLKFAASDANQMPKSVRLEFLRAEDSSTVGVDLTPGSGGTWTGSLTFNGSGVYSSYVILDGEPYDLGNLTKKLDVKLGLFTSIQATGATIFALEDGESAVAGVRAKILYNVNEELRELENIGLYYRYFNQELYAELQWNSLYNAYDGNFQITDSGTYEFDRLVMGNDIISKATQSPVFRVRSSKPASFVSITSNISAFALPGGTPVNMLVKLKNAGGASVAAVFTDASGKEYVVQNTDAETLISVIGTDATDATITEWKIRLPGVTKDGQLDQGGAWTLKELRLGNVMDANGRDYTDENPMVIDNFTGYEDKQTITVVSDFIMTVNPGQKEYTGEFLQTHEKSDLTVDLYFGDHQPLPEEVKNFTLTYTYQDGTSQEHGGYTGGATPEPIVLTMTADDTGMKYTQSAATLMTAGVYKLTQIKLDIGERTLTYTGIKLPAGRDITVESEKPTVKITGVSPAPGTEKWYYTVANPTENDAIIAGDFNRFSDYSAAVYLYFDSNSSRAVLKPSVTMQLSGVISNITSASLIVGHSDSSRSPVTFTFNNGVATNSIGYGDDGSGGILGFGASYPKLYPAGKQIVEEITVVHNGSTYVADLSTSLTIANLVSPPALTFANIQSVDNSYTGETPGKVYSHDGENVTVTLPEVSWTAEMNESSGGENFVMQSGYPKSETVYTTQIRQESGTCGTNDVTYYTPYKKTTTVWVKTSSTVTWAATKTVTGWQIGNQVFKPGETVTVAANQTVTPVITTVDGPKSEPAVKTITRTEITYSQPGTATKDNPGGTKMDSVTPGTTTTEVVS